VGTGADLTQIPEFTAQALELEQVDVMPTVGAHNDRVERPVYVANLTFEGLTFPATWVVGDNCPIARLGLDVLNELVARFDGPARVFELQRP